MEAIQSWASNHKLTGVGALWAAGIGGSLMAYARAKSPMKPSLRLIHARMHAQALTLAVLSGAAAYHYYDEEKNHPHVIHPKSLPDTTHPSPNATITKPVQWELHSPF